MEEQYPEESYVSKGFVVRFDGDSGSPRVGIQVHNADVLKDNGWDFYVENGTEENKVYSINVFVYAQSFYSTDLPKRHRFLGYPFSQST